MMWAVVNKTSIINIISIALLVYYLGGFFVFVLVNSSLPVEYKFEPIAPDLLADWKVVNDWSKEKCAEQNSKYKMNFDCDTTPYIKLRNIPYDKLPLGEKIESTLADFFKAVAGLVGRDFWSFRGIHIVLAFFSLAPLVVLAGVPLLWRLARWALRRAQAPEPANPHYRMVLGVFAGVVALLVVAVVLVAMQERPGAQASLTDGRVESYKTTVNNLLN